MRHLASFLVAFSLSALLTPLFGRLAVVAGALDEPGEGKLHSGPVPYLGGAAMFSAFCFACLGAGIWEVWRLLLPGTLVLALGLYDDLRGCRPEVKLSALVLASLIAAGLGLRPDVISHPFGGPIGLGYLSWPAAVLWLVGTSSALDLVDGLDGLAGGVCFVASGCMAALGLLWEDQVPASLASALAGASLGFLVYNFPPARIFMGDAGALFLGFLLGGISLMVGPCDSTALPAAAVVLWLPIMDLSAAVLRRLASHRSILSADMEHVHHRLLRMGLSPRRAVLLLYLVCAFFGLCALAMAGGGPLGVVSGAFALGAIPAVAVLLRRSDAKGSS